MPIPNIYSILYNGVWAMLESRKPWAALVKEPNRRKLGAVPNPFKTALGDGDFPTALLLQGDGSDSAATASRTFGTFAATPCTTRIEELARELQLVLVHQFLKLDENNNLILETLAALREGQATLGALLKTAVSYGAIKQYGPITYRHDDTGRSVPMLPIPLRGETLRAVTFFRIPITAIFNGQSTSLLN